MATPKPRHALDVDPRERAARLPALAQACDGFDVRIRQLPIGDYLIDGSVVVERKTYADFASSLIDGRLFPQAASLARGPHRPLILLEGPRPDRLPAVHPHALQGAIASLAVMWRLPVIEAPTPEDALRLFRVIAEQVGRTRPLVLKRYDRKPKRQGSRRLYVLQGLPGVGPAVAARMLARFGSVERAMVADVEALMEIDGLGPAKAARIRDLVAAETGRAGGGADGCHRKLYR
jgi:DNA excision repair protein ERCC-4